MTEDEIVGWDHRLNGHECEHAQGDSEGQSRLACRGPWGCEESDTTERLDNKNGAGFSSKIWAPFPKDLL